MSSTRVNTLQCFVRRDGKYLMLHRGAHKRIMPNVWMAPGGHVEEGEGVIECARRELLEETGLAVKNVRIRAAGMALLKDLSTELQLHLLTADYESGSEIDSEDGELVWMKPEEIPDLQNILAELPPVLSYVFDCALPVVSYKAIYRTGNELERFEIESA